MSELLEHRLRQIVADFDALMLSCTLLGLPEVTKRLEPIRDVIQRGIELRELAQREAAALKPLRED